MFLIVMEVTTKVVTLPWELLYAGDLILTAEFFCEFRRTVWDCKTESRHERSENGHRENQKTNCKTANWSH